MTFCWRKGFTFILSVLSVGEVTSWEGEGGGREEGGQGGGRAGKEEIGEERERERWK